MPGRGRLRFQGLLRSFARVCCMSAERVAGAALRIVDIFACQTLDFTRSDPISETKPKGAFETL